MSELEYIQALRFCSEHGLICLEYHRRNRKGREVRQVAACNRMYGNKTDIARTFHISLPTVYRRLEGLEKEIGKRYNHYAIADNLISLAVFADYYKYHKWLADKNLRKHVPPFDMYEARRYLEDVSDGKEV